MKETKHSNKMVTEELATKRTPVAIVFTDPRTGNVHYVPADDVNVFKDLFEVDETWTAKEKF